MAGAEKVVKQAVEVGEKTFVEGLEMGAYIVAYDLFRSRVFDIEALIGEKLGLSRDVAGFIAGVGIAVAGKYMKNSYVMKIGTAVAVVNALGISHSILREKVAEVVQ